MMIKIVAGLTILIMLLLSFSPLKLTMFYLFARPLLQPIANEGHKVITGVPLTGILPMIFIMASLINCFFRRTYSFMMPNILPLYLLLFFSMTSFVNSLSYSFSVAHVFKVASGVSMYMLVYNGIETKADANRLLYALAITSVVPMLFGYYQFVTKTARVDGDRIDSLFGMANAYGEFLSVTFCATLMRLLQPASRSQRIFLILIIASLAVSMLLSRNRGQWIALTTGLFFAYTGYMNKLKIRWFVIAGALIGIIFSGMIIERFSELEEENQWGHSKNTFENRQENWKTAVSIVPNHFFTGHGIGTSKMVWEKEFGREHVPHNDYLRLVLETGIFGLSFYLLFLFTVLVKNVMLISDKTNWFINYPSLALIIYWMLHSAFQNIIYNVIVFPIFMALVALAAKWNICLSREPVCESETSEQPLTLSSYATDKPI